MRAVIMAAGMGRRMNNSIEMPKSILPVGETTIIRHTVKMLTDNGISTAVVVGYRKNDIYSALQGLPVTYYFNPFFKVTNSMASLWFAKEFLSSKDDIILCNADVFWQDDILNEVLKDDHRIVMLGDKTRGSVGDYCFELTEDSFINSFGKNLEDGKKHTEYVGIGRIKKDFVLTFCNLLNDAVEREVYDLWWENVIYDNCIRYPIFVKDISEHFWGEVDVMSDYMRIQEYAENHHII